MLVFYAKKMSEQEFCDKYIKSLIKLCNKNKTRGNFIAYRVT